MENEFSKPSSNSMFTTLEENFNASLLPPSTYLWLIWLCLTKSSARSKM